MLALLNTFLNIALRRSGPEDLPAMPLLATLACLFYVATGIPHLVAAYGWGSGPLRLLLADLVLVAGSAWLLLVFCGLRSRFVQTVTALFGAGAVLSLIALPLRSAFELAMREGSGLEGSVGLLAGIALFALIIWSVIVNAHILSRALSRPFVLGLMLAIALFVISFELEVFLGAGA